MQTINFVTSNLFKFAEVKAYLADIANLVQCQIDVDEIQSMDAEEVVLHKARSVRQEAKLSSFFVEDTSLFIHAFNGFPGPFIKFMEKSIGRKGFYEAVKSQQGSMKATVMTSIVYFNNGHTELFQGKVEGTIVTPSGPDVFGFDCIFVPDGHSETYANMSLEKKNTISHRAKALKLFKDYLSLDDDERYLHENQL